ncbi:NAC domain-containing protein 30 [Sesamum alatum]|uniref:NAC domain-containing protein 30 n=1 Tax=Sesamum alatum TaxID=300844 RepID=A0AAE2C8V6_9LAMI|nr:NAC domain-containing protein 30 [Sesamum alatum]
MEWNTSEHAPPQEEGWVVCRAFKKPNPSHKQGFEAWNNAYYIRNSSNYRLPSYPTTSSTIMHNNFDSSLNQGTTSNFHQSSFPAESTLKSSHSPFESQVVELPKLDSPSISTSFATNDTNFEHSFVANDQETEDEKSNFGNQFSDWNKLLATQVNGVSSYAYTNMALLPHSDDELDAQNHLSHVLDQCFPDL